MVWGMWVREVILAVPTCIGRKKRGREGWRGRLALSWVGRRRGMWKRDGGELRHRRAACARRGDGDETLFSTVNNHPKE